MDRDLIILGDVYAGLNYIKDNSISVVITSPPYWKQRDYGFEGQIGQEETPEEYIGKLVQIFNKLYEKLKDNGVFFLNIGDKYLEKYGTSHLLQIPYRLAYHLVKNNWKLEDILIWYKPNHLPSSVKDRFTNTYEPILVFTKNKNNIYQNKLPKVIEIPIKPTRLNHTAVYPEELVMNLINRVNLLEGDIILDPFAGTGTTGVVINKIRNSLIGKKVYSILIEKNQEFVNIIKHRLNKYDLIEIKDIPYNYSAIIEDDILNLENIEPKLIMENKYGEIYIALKSDEFLSALKGLTMNEFKKFHREDALFFFGVKEWDLNSLYYIHTIYKYGYVLRNMIVISDGNNWYPIFMFARDSTKIKYRFYIDRVRIKKEIKLENKFKEENFIGMKVIDITNKKPLIGYIVKILEKYEDNFPKLVIVNWEGKASIEFVLNPNNDEYLMESLKFLCPKCFSELLEPYNPIDNNICPYCNQKLWENLETVPIIKEPYEIIEIFQKIENNNYYIKQFSKIEKSNNRKSLSSSKFAYLKRINWGASPGARKIMIGEYFTKTRLYKIEQVISAQYLNLLKKSKNMSIKDIINKLPKEYYHTAGHWFRKDFGGSIPIPKDIDLIKNVFGVESELLNALKRTALKFQTVKTSIKGKNPGDYIKSNNDNEIKEFLKLLYL